MPSSSDAAYPAILQVLPALGGGGVERGTVEIAAAIARAGGRPLVASAGGMLSAAVERAGGQNFLLPLDTKNPRRIWANAAALTRLIRDERVDIVHARSRAPAWSASIAARRAGVRFVTTYHGAYNENVWMKRRYNAVMASGDLVIAISRFIAELIQARHHADPSKIRIIHRGVDPAIFDPDTVTPPRMMRLTNAWRLQDGQPVVLLPGRITRWKGQSVLIEALSRMKNRDVCAVLVGDDQGRSRYVAELSAQAEALGVGDRVRIVGHCDDMPAALRLADVVVNCSTDPEAFGRVVIEAQSMAAPVIATDHGGAVETIEHDVTGWRVTPGDAGELAQGLDYVLSLSNEARAEIGQAARASVIANYTVARMQDATLNVYRELLG
jgi:glycosyltransferase involved in cell wall biosynthesis